MKMLRCSVEDVGILSGLVYGGRSRNLWERQNFHFYPARSRLSHISPQFIQLTAAMHQGKLSCVTSCTSHFWSGSFFHNFPLAADHRSDQFILTHLWTDMGLSLPMDHHLRWAWNADYVAKPDIMSCPRHWVPVLDGAPAVNSVSQWLILGSHSWEEGWGIK